MAHRKKKAFVREARHLIALGGPAALTQLGAMLLGVVDTLMVGRLGVHELDAVSLGNVWVHGTLIFGMGMVLGLDPIFAQAHGARDGKRVGLTLQQGLVVALLASVPIAACWTVTEPVLKSLAQLPSLAAASGEYLLPQIPSIPAFLFFMVLRQYLQGRGVVMPALIITLVANGFNVLANWVLIFGNLGMPAMGLTGAALATSATRIFLLVGLVGYILWRRLYRDAWVPWSRRAFARGDLWLILKSGTPVALQYMLESWAFQVATLMAGTIGAVPLAAHTVALTLAATSFMVPLGLSIGAATRVGHLIGAGKHRQAQQATYVALVLGAAVMVVSAAIFVGLRWHLPRLFTQDAGVIALAATILPIAGAFQLFDGVQAVGAGILRGMGNTLPAALFNFAGYYLLGLPLAAVLLAYTSLELVGIWWALVLSLAAVAAGLAIWLWRRGPARRRGPRVGVPA
ncbi:MATE family efflux transporter [Haliangium ochraceum]|nr:MATE family efflux transporter [Haliangium ochraceum]